MSTVGAGIGVGIVLVVGALSGCLVPVAMTKYGIVISGVGTIHAPMSAYGVAATL